MSQGRTGELQGHILLNALYVFYTSSRFFCLPHRQYSVGFEVITVSENVPNAPGAFKRITSGDFRSVLVHVVVCGGYYVCVLGGDGVG